MAVGTYRESLLSIQLFLFFSDSISKKKREISYKEPLLIDESISKKNRQLLLPDDGLEPFAVIVLDSVLSVMFQRLISIYPLKCSTFTLDCQRLAYSDMCLLFLLEDMSSIVQQSSEMLLLWVLLLYL